MKNKFSSKKNWKIKEENSEHVQKGEIFVSFIDTSKKIWNLNNKRKHRRRSLCFPLVALPNARHCAKNLVWRWERWTIFIDFRWKIASQCLMEKTPKKSKKFSSMGKITVLLQVAPFFISFFFHYQNGITFCTFAICCFFWEQVEIFSHIFLDR